jgi:hypothetical protein
MVILAGSCFRRTVTFHDPGLEATAMGQSACFLHHPSLPSKMLVGITVFARNKLQAAWRRSRSLLCSRPHWERQASYRAARLSGPTPRTCSNVALKRPGYRLTIRLTHFGRPVSQIFWKMTGLLKPLRGSPAMPTAGPRNSMTAEARRCFSKIWSEMPSSAFLSKCRVR